LVLAISSKQRLKPLEVYREVLNYAYLFYFAPLIEEYSTREKNGKKILRR
jgi:hypothetical protein